MQLDILDDMNFLEQEVLNIAKENLSEERKVRRE